MNECGRGLGPALGWAARLVKADMDSRVSQYDVTPAQVRVLLYLHNHGGRVPQQELADCLRAKPSTVNGVLDRMEEKDLVRRSVSGRDARRRFISLTEKGAEQRAIFQRSFQEAEEAMVRGLTQEERETLLRLLDRVIQNLKPGEPESKGGL